MRIKSDLNAHEYMKTELENFIADVHMQNLTDTHPVNSDPKHGRLRGHDASTARSINLLKTKRNLLYVRN